jgi:trimeric autotransporter adhesin
MTYKATFAKKLSCQIAGGLLVALMAASTLTYAQSAAVSSVVPNVVNYNGTLSDASGKPITAISGVTFSLYKDSEGGAPLWMETQNLQPDSRGHFSAKLGSASGRGLPADLFASGEARWLGVRPQGQEEQPRVLLLSVPYALKALDAETLGGKPASAFLTAPSANSGVLNPATNVTGSGTKDFIPM